MTDGEPVPEHALGPLLRDLHAASLELTERELLTLRAVSHGLTHAMAADALHWSRSVIDDSLETAAIKLRAKNTVHAVATALRLGLIP